MNTEKLKTLEQVQDASDIVEKAIASNDVSEEEKLELEKVSLKLRDLERSITRKTSKDLVDSLNTDVRELKELANEINKASGKLAGIANAIKKVAGLVEVLATVAAKVVSAGIL